MRAILLILALVAGCCYSKLITAHFTMEFPTLKYKADGHGYVEVAVYGLDLTKEVTAFFNGTFTDETGANHYMEGNVSVPDPPLSNLDKIKAKGHWGTSPKVTFEAKAVVSIWDILKPKIPFKGHATFSNGKEGDLTGIVDRPTSSRRSF